MKKDFWISKRKSFPLDAGYTRQLVLVKGDKAMTTPLNKMIKKLKLNRDFHFRDFSNNGNELILERIIRKKYKERK